MQQPRAGRRRRAQLRRQRPAAARGAVRRHLDSAGGRRCRRIAGRRAVRVAPAAREAARGAHGPDRQKGSLLGPAFSDERDLPNSSTASARHVPPRRRASGAARRVVDLLAAEKIVGWFQGRMEFGPRALGARSILGDPRSPRMQATMNLKIKFRESFRPFAPMRAPGASAPVVRARAGPGEPVHAARGAGAGGASRADLRRASARSMADDPDLRKRVNIPARRFRP